MFRRCLLLLLFASFAQPHLAHVSEPLTSFSDAWGDGRSIVGFEPNSDGPQKRYPVYIWLAGTGLGWHNRSTDRDQLRRMASLGTVAGQCAYTNWIYPIGGCQGFLNKAKPIFDTSLSNSCLSRLCARPAADCSQGVAVHGFSQGAQLVSLARYFAPEVTASLVQGHGDNPIPFSDLSSCMDYDDRNGDGGKRNSYHPLLRNQVRSLVGEHDMTFSCCYEAPDPKCCWHKRTGREQQTAVTGYSCADGVLDCLQPDGSGWYMISDAEAGKTEGANHCFAWAGACPALAGANDEWNPRYIADCKWCLDNNLQWLRSTSIRFAEKAASDSIVAV
eukprot:TRINITY_DN3775_c0_g1_i1.p1 TRINITY_DN3775_c0_g1~~TRINITY_DN3775_c0_g1_i1.p1  ORF type:complete len:332 (+),score=37.23 TRINITY_DN3775_c0_g1_i1:49-1044(+)